MSSPIASSLSIERTAKQFKVAARDLVKPPRRQSKNRVHVGGEPLSEPIYWQGH
jgi:hypothetical protein